MEVADLIPRACRHHIGNVPFHRDHPEVLVREQSPRRRYFVANAVGHALFFIVPEKPMSKTARYGVTQAPVRVREQFPVPFVSC
jgi:hypothetical protein